MSVPTMQLKFPQNIKFIPTAPPAILGWSKLQSTNCWKPFRWNLWNCTPIPRSAVPFHKSSSFLPGGCMTVVDCIVYSPCTFRGAFFHSFHQLDLNETREMVKNYATPCFSHLQVYRNERWRKFLNWLFCSSASAIGWLNNKKNWATETNKTKNSRKNWISNRFRKEKWMSGRDESFMLEHFMERKVSSSWLGSSGNRNVLRALTPTTKSTKTIPKERTDLMWWLEHTPLTPCTWDRVPMIVTYDD